MIKLNQHKEKGLIVITTIKDIAKEAGVSPSTVSIVINGQFKERKIPDSTVNKVLEAVKKLNYQPNIAAKKLRSNNTKEFTIGIYWATDFRSNYLSRFITGIQEEVIKNNYPVNIVICPFKNDNLHAEKKIKSMNYFNLVILATTSKKDMDFLQRTIIPIPVILFNRKSSKYHSVNLDNADAGKKAADYLIKKKIKRIGIISNNSRYIANSERLDSFLMNCRKNNIQVKENNIYISENSIAGGYNVGSEILKSINNFEAIFCSSDSIALGLLNYFSSRGINVPQKIKVLSFGMNNPENNKYSCPPLTVVDIPIEEMASRSIKLSMDILSRKVENIKHIDYFSKVISRKSC
jgi:LacI family purine nucleotide synthesis repressor